MRILFVIGRPSELERVRQVLQAQRGAWEATYVDRVDEAWERLLQTEFDTVVVDADLTGMKGFELLGNILETEQTKHLPVIMLAGLSNPRLRRQVIQHGAVDLLNRPIDEVDLLARLDSALRLKAAQDALAAREDRLEEKVRERAAELSRSRLSMIWRLGKLAEYREELTGSHVIRVGFFSRIVAEQMELPREFAETLFQAAPLHDVGNIGIPDVILQKRESLTPREWEIIKQHCVIGEKILREDVEIAGLRDLGIWGFGDLGIWGFGDLGTSAPAALENPEIPRSQNPASTDPVSPAAKDPVLEMAAAIALTHHEKWDGSGYPQKLSGISGKGADAIPLESRIVAICDVFDALTSERPYRESHPEDVAVEIIQSASGKHFDPEVCAAFLKAVPQIRSVREAFSAVTLSNNVQAMTGVARSHNAEPDWDEAAWIFEDEVAPV